MPYLVATFASGDANSSNGQSPVQDPVQFPLNLRPEGGVADRALVGLEGPDGDLGVAMATVKEMAEAPGCRSSPTSLMNYWPTPRSTDLLTGAPPSADLEPGVRLVLEVSFALLVFTGSCLPPMGEGQNTILDSS